MFPHVFTFDQVQDSIAKIAKKNKEKYVYLTEEDEEEHDLLRLEEERRTTSQIFKKYLVWITIEENVIAFDESTGFLSVWGWNQDSTFFVVDEEAFEASTERITEEQGDLELLFEFLANNKNHTAGYNQLRKLN
uniref:Uncharacterized protein n=1 Tax=viral metagenome TaxID=1070528 RepID=A0A6C0CCX5_9ZZZZ